MKAAKRHGPVVVVTESNERWVRDTAALLLPGGSAVACLDNVEIVSSRERFGQDFPDSPTCWQIAAFSYVTNRHLLSPSAVARVQLAAAADAAGAGAASLQGSSSRGGGGGGAQGATAAAATSGGAVHASCGESSDSRRRRRSLVRGSSSSSGSASVKGLGTLIAVSTAPRSPDDRAAALTLREHHTNIFAKTVSLTEAPTPLELKDQLDLLAEKLELMFGHAPPQRSEPSSAAATAPASLAGLGRREKERREGPWPSLGNLSDGDSYSSSCPSSPEPLSVVAAAHGGSTAAAGGKHQGMPWINFDDDGRRDEYDEDYMTAPCSASTLSSGSSSSSSSSSIYGSIDGSTLAGTPFVAVHPDSLLSPVGRRGRPAAAPTLPTPPTPPPSRRRRTPRNLATAYR